MKKRLGIFIDWEAAGAQLALGDDEDQAAFFRGLCREMFSWESGYMREMQLCSAAKKLDPEHREFLSCLAPGESK